MGQSWSGHKPTLLHSYQSKILSASEQYHKNLQKPVKFTTFQYQVNPGQRLCVIRCIPIYPDKLQLFKRDASLNCLTENTNSNRTNTHNNDNESMMTKRYSFPATLNTVTKNTFANSNNVTNNNTTTASSGYANAFTIDDNNFTHNKLLDSNANLTALKSDPIGPKKIAKRHNFGLEALGLDVNVLERLNSDFEGENVSTNEYTNLTETQISTDLLNLQNSETLNKKPILYLHGYAACGTFFANSMAAICYSLNRPCYAIDWPGMGLSDRNDSSQSRNANFLKGNGLGTGYQSKQQCLDYFIVPLEQFRRDMGIEKFDIIAHSLGGYLATKFVLKLVQEQNKKMVDHLILASPIGLVKNPKTVDKAFQFSWPSFKFKFLWSVIYGSRLTLNSYIKSLGDNPVSKKGYKSVEEILKKRFNGDSQMSLLGLDPKKAESKNLAINFTHQMLTRPGTGSESAIHDLFDKTIFPHFSMSIQEDIEKLSIPGRELLPKMTVSYGGKKPFHTNVNALKYAKNKNGKSIKSVKTSKYYKDWVSLKDKQFVLPFIKDNSDIFNFIETTGTHHFIITENKTFDEIIYSVLKERVPSEEYCYEELRL